MKSVVFTIPGRLGGKQRAGRRRIAGNIVSFNPKQTTMQEGMVAQIAALAMREQRCAQMQGAVSVGISIFRHTPISWSKKKTAAAKWITGKPDIDNAAKLIFDGLNHSGLWIDDAQVAALSLRRKYANELAECTTVVVEELEP